MISRSIKDSSIFKTSFVIYSNFLAFLRTFTFTFFYHLFYDTTICSDMYFINVCSHIADFTKNKKWLIIKNFPKNINSIWNLKTKSLWRTLILICLKNSFANEFTFLNKHIKIICLNIALNFRPILSEMTISHKQLLLEIRKPSF